MKIRNIHSSQDAGILREYRAGMLAVALLFSTNVMLAPDMEDGNDVYTGGEEVVIPSQRFDYSIDPADDDWFHINKEQCSKLVVELEHLDPGFQEITLAVYPSSPTPPTTPFQTAITGVEKKATVVYEGRNLTQAYVRVAGTNVSGAIGYNINFRIESINAPFELLIVRSEKKVKRLNRKLRRTVSRKRRALFRKRIRKAKREIKLYRSRLCVEVK